MPTDEEYLKDLREFSDELGKPPTKAEMNNDGPHSTTPYYTRWGSWNDAPKEAGLRTNHREVATEDSLADLQRLADKYGESVLVEMVNEHGKYGTATYLRRFDSWFDARDQAGLLAEDIREGCRVDEDELIDAVRALAMELGRPPSQYEMNRRGDRSVTPYIRQWGTWGLALEATGLSTDQ